MKLPGLNFQLPTQAKAAPTFSGQQAPMAMKKAPEPQVDGNLLSPKVGGPHAMVGTRLNCRG